MDKRLLDRYGCDFAYAAGMGSTFTAISDDASGLIDNQPGMADVKRGGIFTGLPLTELPRVTSGEPRGGHWWAGTWRNKDLQLLVQLR